MRFTALSKTLLNKTKEGKELVASDYPSDIILDSHVTSSLKSIENYTNSSGNKQQGAAGWEYAVTAFFLIDEIYISSAIAGDYSSVSIKNSVDLKPLYKDNNTKVQFELSIGKKKFKTKYYITSELMNGYLYGNVASFHTHPKYFLSPGTFQYTFFSGQDIISLLSSNAPILGLIAGRKLWLACKTSKSRMIPNGVLAEASQIELMQGQDGLNKYVKENLKEFGIVFYAGSLGGRLNKL